MLSLSAVAQACGTSLIEAKGFEAKRQACLESVNNGIMVLSKAKAVVGKYNTCAIATAFYDALVTGGLAKGTSANYLSTFRKAVAEGKPVVEWNPAQNKKAKAKAKAKGSSAKGKKGFADKLATVYRDADFAGFINDLQDGFNDAHFENLIDGVKSYLEAEGVKLD